MADSEDGTRQSAQDEGQDMALPVCETAPATVMPSQWYTQVAHVYLQAACSRFSLGATRCFLYIIRHADGFHKPAVALSISEFMEGRRKKDGTTFDEGTLLSRPSVIAGLEELRRAHVIDVEMTGRGRGRVTSYRICSPDTWTLDAGNGQESLPITIGKKSLPITPDNGKELLPIPPIIGKESLPPLNKEKKERRLKERARDAHASDTAQAPVAPPVSAPSTHAVNPHWDALVALFGYTPATKTERSNWGKVVKELKEAGATPQDIPARAKHYIARYGRERLTINALLKHWTECSMPPPASSANGRAAYVAPEPVRTLSYEPSDPWK